MIAHALTVLARGENLSYEEAYNSMQKIFAGEATPVQISSFLTGLRVKGETIEEIAACAKVMREKATRIPTKHKTLVDTCGTGGDGGITFNVSTASALVAAGAGAIVAKHGNRAISSKSGSSDVLKALGVEVETMTAEMMTKSLDEIGISFLFAPLLHSAMKFAAPIRRELGFRTVFNILGPLTNPAGAQRQVIGVFNENLAKQIADVLVMLGTEHAWVVHGAGGFDEISTLGKTTIFEVKNQNVKNFYINPEEFQIKIANVEDVKGSDPANNAEILLQIFGGKKGPYRDITLMNTAAALVVSGIANDFPEGIKKASESIDNGCALKKLEELRRYSHAG